MRLWTPASVNNAMKKFEITIFDAAGCGRALIYNPCYSTKTVYGADHLSDIQEKVKAFVRTVMAPTCIGKGGKK